MDYFIVILYDPRLDNQTELKAFIRKKNKKLYYPSYKIIKCSVYRDLKLLTKHVNVMTAVICQVFFCLAKLEKLKTKLTSLFKIGKVGRKFFIKEIFQSLSEPSSSDPAYFIETLFSESRELRLFSFSIL